MHNFKDEVELMSTPQVLLSLPFDNTRTMMRAGNTIEETSVAMMAVGAGTAVAGLAVAAWEGVKRREYPENGLAMIKAGVLTTAASYLGAGAGHNIQESARDIQRIKRRVAAMSRKRSTPNPLVPPYAL